MKFFSTYLKTAFQLGLINCLVFIYYLILSSSFIAPIIFRRKIFTGVDKNIFTNTNSDKNSKKNILNVSSVADSIIQGQFKYFSFHNKSIGMPPNWFLDPFNKKVVKSDSHWSKINDFNYINSDIKNIWELSRFNWLGSLAIAYLTTQNKIYINTMNKLIRDWMIKNQFNCGPNWKCGQESSIRVINLIVSYEIIGVDRIEQNFEELTLMHLQRISKTTIYAKVQNNNHAITEGIAQYIAGLFLYHKTSKHKYKYYIRKGSNLLEERLNSLVLEDGTFSQYSIVYHRMLLDLLSISELFRQKYQGKRFSEQFKRKVKLAVSWYEDMIDPISGDASNIGGNDGTYLFNYDQKKYRDFRPTLNFICSLYKLNIRRELVSTHCLLSVFDIPLAPLKQRGVESKFFPNGGFIKLENTNGNALLRIPNYKFRPSHSDGLHLDIWHDGINWIRDAGSYSYGASIDDQEFFSGTKGHSTIIFDGENQMPRISRFLFGNWLIPSYVKFDMSENFAKSAYLDLNNNSHSRSVKYINNGWEIVDEVKGNFTAGILQYILKPNNWKVIDNKILNDEFSILINSDKFFSIELCTGYESVYYMEKTKTTILKINFKNSCTIKSKLEFIS